MPRILQARKPCIRQNVCTSLRIRRFEERRERAYLAYVKTYALH